MTHLMTSSRRLLLALAVGSLPLAASTCGSKDPQPAVSTTTVPVVYTVRYSITGNGTQIFVDRPYCQLSLNGCDATYDNAHSVSCPTGDLNTNELLPQPVGAYSDVVTNIPTTTVALTNQTSLSGKTLYLSARFYSALANPPATTSVIQADLLADGAPIQSVSLNYADAQLLANRYYIGQPGNYDVMKYMKFTLP